MKPDQPNNEGSKLEAQSIPKVEIRPLVPVKQFFYPDDEIRILKVESKDIKKLESFI